MGLSDQTGGLRGILGLGDESGGLFITSRLGDKSGGLLISGRLGNEFGRLFVASGLGDQASWLRGISWLGHESGGLLITGRLGDKALGCVGGLEWGSGDISSGVGLGRGSASGDVSGGRVLVVHSGLVGLLIRKVLCDRLMIQRVKTHLDVHSESILVSGVFDETVNSVSIGVAVRSLLVSVAVTCDRTCA